MALSGKAVFCAGEAPAPDALDVVEPLEGV
jgi:hypothetical protein